MKFLPLLILLFIFYCKEVFTKKKKSACNTGYAANTPILVVISFDGFQFKYLNSSYPTLLQHYRAGARVNYKSLFFGNALNVHHTIATGYYPNKHGVFSHEWKNNKNEFVKYSKQQYENNLTIRHKVIPIWTLNELNGGTSACMMWPGCEFRYGPDNAMPLYQHKYNHAETYNARLKRVIDWMNESITLKPPNLVMIYFEQPDYTAHRYGPFSPEVGDRLKEVDKFLKDFEDKLRILNLYKKINLVLLSDHPLEEIFYKDIFDIESQGICTDVGLFGSDVWLQQQYYSRTSKNTTKCNGEYCVCPKHCCKIGGKMVWLDSYSINHRRNLKTNYNTYYNCELLDCYMNGLTGDPHGNHPKEYNYSKCLKFMYEENMPTFQRICPNQYGHFPEIPADLIANYTILVNFASNPYPINLTLNTPIALSYKAFGTKLFPKIKKWVKECPLDLNECTRFGVHAYSQKGYGFFVAVGPAFVKNRNFKYWQFNAEDIYSGFAKVLEIRGDQQKDGSFSRIRPIFNELYLLRGKDTTAWLQMILMIIMCAIFHCIMFYYGIKMLSNRKIIPVPIEDVEDVDDQ